MEEQIRNDQIAAGGYSRKKRRLAVLGGLLQFSVAVLFIATGLNLKLEGFASAITANEYSAMLIFVAVLTVILELITFPISFYSSFILEHKYGLSAQSLPRYFAERFKSAAIGAAFGIPVLLAFYFIIRNYPDEWWLIFGVFMFAVSFIIGKFFPVAVFPLFYRLSRIQDPEIEEHIRKISAGAGINVEGVYTFNMSKNTNKVNAFFAGMGNTKRILLADTLISNFTAREIAAVFAHEAGHYYRRHIKRLMLLSVVLTFAGLYLTSLAYSGIVAATGLADISRPASLPLLGLLLSVYSFITSPLTNIVSRRFEREADAYALESTGDSGAFISAMEKLSSINLSERSPDGWIEFLFHSHPSTEKRISFARAYSSESNQPDYHSEDNIA